MPYLPQILACTTAPHVVRGGAYGFDARALRTYARNAFQTNFRLEYVGFRVAL